MSTSANKTLVRHAAGLLATALFVALFGAIYEHFSHEVYSYSMIYAFAIPLVLGVLPYLIMALKDKGQPGRTFLNLWNAGIITLTVGSLFKGVLDIYGTTNRLLTVYPIAGGVLLLAGLACAYLRR